MSIIITDGCDCAEKQLLNNWAAEYSKRAIEDHKTAETIDHPDGSVTTDKIKNGAVSTDKVADKSITTEKIASGAVTTDILAGISITTDKISNAAVTEAKLGNSSITTDKVKDGAITENKLADYSVTTTRIAQGAVNNNRIANGAVDARTIQDYSVTGDKLADNAVVERTIKDGAVKNEKLGYLAVKSNKVSEHGIEASRIQIGAVKSPQRFSVSEIRAMDNLIGLGVETLFIVCNDTEQRVSEIRTTADNYLMGIFDYNESPAYLEPGRSYLVGMYYHKTSMDAMLEEQIQENGVMRSCKVHIIDVIAQTENKSYSSVPERIGAWIDGTPVWRYAFDISIDEISGFLPEDKAVNMIDLKIDEAVNDYSDIFIINGFCVAQSNTNKSIVDDQAGYLNNMSTFDFSLNFAPTLSGFYGWIEFVTAESNIKEV